MIHKYIHLFTIISRTKLTFDYPATFVRCTAHYIFQDLNKKLFLVNVPDSVKY